MRGCLKRTDILLLFATYGKISPWACVPTLHPRQCGLLHITLLSSLTKRNDMEKKRGRHICFTCLSMVKVSEKEYFAGNQHHQEPIMLTGSGPVLLNHSHSPMNCTANAFHFWAPRTFTQSVTSVESFVAGCFWRQKWFSPLREIITASLHD